MTTSHNFSPEDLEKTAKEHGQRLAFLLATLNIDDKQRQAWLTLLPEMSLEELDRLLNILEAKYLDQQSQGSAQKFKKDVKDAQTKYDKKIEDLNETTLDKLKNLSDKLD